MLVAMDSPYDYEVVSDFGAYICTYGVAAASVRAAVKFITGERTDGAIPPISIANLGEDL